MSKLANFDQNPRSLQLLKLMFSTVGRGDPVYSPKSGLATPGDAESPDSCLGPTRAGLTLDKYSTYDILKRSFYTLYFCNNLSIRRKVCLI